MQINYYLPFEISRTTDRRKRERILSYKLNLKVKLTTTRSLRSFFFNIRGKGGSASYFKYIRTISNPCLAENNRLFLLEIFRGPANYSLLRRQISHSLPDVSGRRSKNKKQREK